MLAYHATSTQQLQIIETVAQVIAALATVAAVIVSLWLASHQSRAKLRLMTALVSMVPRPPTRASKESYFRLSASNTGHRDALVTGIGWRLGLFRKTHMIQLLSEDLFSAGLPKLIPPAQEATWLWPEEQWERIRGKLVEELGRGPLRHLRLRTIRLGLFLATGEEFYRPIDAQVRRNIQTAFKSAK